MKSRWKSAWKKRKEHKQHPLIRYLSGSFLLLLGILGLLLPLAPGIPFLLAALYLFNPVWFKKKAKWLKEKLKTFRR